MKELLVVVIPCIILAFFAENNSITTTGHLGEKLYIQKDKAFWAVMTVIMVVYAGLRITYNDTTTYRLSYEILPTDTTVFSEIDWAIGSNPVFHFINACLKVVGVSTQSFLMIYAFITLSIYMWFIRKYTDNLWMSVFLFFAMGCYTFTLAAIKQTVAVAFCLLATDRALQKKWPGFVIWIVLATLIHPYSLMYLAIPFLTFNPWTTKTYIMLALFGTLGVGLQSLLGTIIDITSMMGEEYSVDEFSGDGVNIFRVLVMWAPALLSYFSRHFLKDNNDKARNVIINLMMLNAEILFIGLFGTANYFARLANYFLIFQVLALPMLFKHFNRNSHKVLMTCAIGGYLLYFVYAEAIVLGGFDFMYSRMKLFDYIRTLF